MEESSHPLVSFAGEVLRLRGAEVEASSGKLSALLPEKVSRVLRLPELVTLQTDATRALPGEQVLAYGSPLLDDLVGLLGQAGQLASVAVEIEYLKRSGFEGELSRVVGFTNALSQVVRTSSQVVPYLVLTYLYQALSDEQRRGLVTVSLNARTLAGVLGFPEALALAHRTERPPLPHLFSLSAPREQIFAKGGQMAQKEAKKALSPFLLAMERRRQNEAMRLHAYYADLFAEAHAKAHRAHKEDRKQSHLARAQTISQELEKKLVELSERYAVEVSVESVAVLLVALPAVVVSIRVRRRASEVERIAVYNPLLKSFDPFVCDACHQDTSALTACDEEVHLTCAGCNLPCPHCQKASCRACHPTRCGRCGKSRGEGRGKRGEGEGRERPFGPGKREEGEGKG